MNTVPRTKRALYKPVLTRSPGCKRYAGKRAYEYRQEPSKFVYYRTKGDASNGTASAISVLRKNKRYLEFLCSRFVSIQVQRSLGLQRYSQTMDANKHWRIGVTRTPVDAFPRSAIEPYLSKCYRLRTVVQLLLY